MSKSQTKSFDEMSTEELLNTAMDDIPEPALVPAGRWVLRCQASKVLLPREGESFKYAYFLMHTPVLAVEADAALVAEGKWRGAAIFSRVAITSARDHANAKRLFEAHGLSTDGRNPNAIAEVAKGSFVEASVGIRSYERRDGTTVTENTVSAYRPSNYRDIPDAA